MVSLQKQTMVRTNLVSPYPEICHWNYGQPPYGEHRFKWRNIRRSSWIVYVYAEQAKYCRGVYEITIPLYMMMIYRLRLSLQHSSNFFLDNPFRPMV